MNDSSVRFVSTAEQPNTVETFCNTPHPTAKQFDALQENDKLQGFRDYLKVFAKKKIHFSLGQCFINQN